jgi:hypothetical protein
MKKFLFLAAAISMFALGSCTPSSKQITVEVRLEHEGVPYSVGETVFKGDTAVRFEAFAFYLSDLSLGGAVVEEVAFLNAQDSASLQFTWNLEKAVNSLSFGIGVDSLNNAMDPTTFDTDHPLSSANAMYWTWATKYRFLKIDGRSNATGVFGADDKLLAWHTGKDELYRKVTLSQTIKPGDHLVLHFNLDQLLNQISLAKESMTHTMVDDYDIAVRVSDVVPGTFSLSVE